MTQLYSNTKGSHNLIKAKLSALRTIKMETLHNLQFLSVASCHSLEIQCSLPIGGVTLEKRIVLPLVDLVS